MHSLRRLFALAAAVFAAAVGAACDGALNLPPATSINAVDTIRIYALRNTPIAQPSGYHVSTRTIWRTDSPGFDIAFDIDDSGTPLIYPAGALGLPRDPGILKMTGSFESVEAAPVNETYDTDSPLAIPAETVFVVRSAPFGGDCGIAGSLPRYGKFRVLAVDPATRSVSLEVLVNVNCGYRDLRPGIPLV